MSNVVNNYPVVVARTNKTVTLGFTANGKEVRVEVNKTMLKGMARWCAKKLQAEGATVPEYNTKECKDWAASLRAAANG